MARPRAFRIQAWHIILRNSNIENRRLHAATGVLKRGLLNFSIRTIFSLVTLSNEHGPRDFYEGAAGKCSNSVQFLTPSL